MLNSPLFDGSLSTEVRMAASVWPASPMHPVVWVPARRVLFMKSVQDVVFHKVMQEGMIRFGNVSYLPTMMVIPFSPYVYLIFCTWWFWPSFFQTYCHILFLTCGLLFNFQSLDIYFAAREVTNSSLRLSWDRGPSCFWATRSDPAMVCKEIEVSSNLGWYSGTSKHPKLGWFHRFNITITGEKKSPAVLELTLWNRMIHDQQWQSNGWFHRSPRIGAHFSKYKIKPGLYNQPLLSD